MAKVLGIIAEYNPLHNGHVYHLQKSICETECDYVVSVISGNFVQRGNTSIINKWKKAEMALKSGVNLVIELPTIYSTASAEGFAYGAIKTLNIMKIIKYISFGTETNDMAALNNVANLLVNEPKKYQTLLKEELKKGQSFPKAREIAVLKIMNDNLRYENILSNPNNILAVEYLKSLKKLRSTMKPYIVKREKVYYNDDFIIDDFASGTAIRKLLARKQNDDIRKVMPQSSYEILMQELEKENIVLDLYKLEKEIIFNLRNMSVKQIKELQDVSEGLEYSIKNAADSCNNLEELINIIKSKRYTRNKITKNTIIFFIRNNKKESRDS